MECICKRVFTTEQELLTHRKRSRHGIERFACPDCEATLINRSSLTRHRRDACRKRVQEGAWRCEFCLKLFDSERKLVRHDTLSSRHGGSRGLAPWLPQEHSASSALSILQYANASDQTRQSSLSHEGQV